VTLPPIALAAMLVIAASLSPGRAGADPALWLVKGAKANVYLFGTVHLMKTGVVWTTPR